MGLARSTLSEYLHHTSLFIIITEVCLICPLPLARPEPCVVLPWWGKKRLCFSCAAVKDPRTHLTQPMELRNVTIDCHGRTAKLNYYMVTNAPSSCQLRYGEQLIYFSRSSTALAAPSRASCHSLQPHPSLDVQRFQSATARMSLWITLAFFTCNGLFLGPGYMSPTTGW